VRGYLVHFTWAWARCRCGFVNCFIDRGRKSCYWIQHDAYGEARLANVVAHLTGGNVWVKTDEGEYPIIEKRRVHIFSYRVEAIEL
jgi:hypothetical protein